MCDLKNVNTVFRIVENESNVSPSVTSNTAGCSQVCGTPHVINRVNGIIIIISHRQLKKRMPGENISTQVSTCIRLVYSFGFQSSIHSKAWIRQTM